MKRSMGFSMKMWSSLIVKFWSVMIRSLACRHRFHHVMVRSLACRDPFLSIQGSVPTCKDLFHHMSTSVPTWHGPLLNMLESVPKHGTICSFDRRHWSESGSVKDSQFYWDVPSSFPITIPFQKKHRLDTCHELTMSLFLCSYLGTMRLDF